VDFKPKTNRQRYAIAELSKRGDLQDLISYLQSLKGKRSYLDIPSLKVEGTDTLARKREGTILDLFQRMLDTNVAHTPADASTDWIGVEIECFIPLASLDAVMYECEECGTQFNPDDHSGDCPDCGRYARDWERSSGPRASLKRLFRDDKIKFCSIKHDGSINPEDSDYYPVEITVLTRLSKPTNLQRACQLLSDLGAKVNKSCGLHVHLDARHLTTDQAKAVGKRIGACLPVLTLMVPRSRLSNTYCKIGVSKLRGDRYYAVNMTSYRKYRTVEIRLHSGTTDFNKIYQWSVLLSSISKASRLPRRVTDLNELTDYVYIPEETLEYATQRTALFSSGSSQTALTYQDSDSTDLSPAVQEEIHSISGAIDRLVQEMRDLHTTSPEYQERLARYRMLSDRRRSLQRREPLSVERIDQTVNQAISDSMAFPQAASNS